MHGLVYHLLELLPQLWFLSAKLSSEATFQMVPWNDGLSNSLDHPWVGGLGNFPPRRWPLPNSRNSFFQFLDAPGDLDRGLGRLRSVEFWWKFTEWFSNCSWGQNSISNDEVLVTWIDERNKLDKVVAMCWMKNTDKPPIWSQEIPNHNCLSEHLTKSSQDLTLVQLTTAFLSPTLFLYKLFKNIQPRINNISVPSCRLPNLLRSKMLYPSAAATLQVHPTFRTQLRYVWKKHSAHVPKLGITPTCCPFVDLFCKTRKMYTES